MQKASRFTNKPDELQAARALESIPPGERDRVFAESISHHIEKRFAEAFGLKQSSGRVCIQRLLGRTCTQWLRSHRMGECECLPPGTDHPSLWLKNGKPVVFVSQPYGVTAKTMADMNKFAEKHGLEFDVGAEMSWWYPSRTVLVCWRKKESTVIPSADKRDFL